MDYKINALIINWNGTEDTIELLQSLRSEHSKQMVIDVFVVDNGSTTEQLAKLEKAIAEIAESMYIRLIKNPNNLGIPAAYNQAIAAVRSKDSPCLRLDNDVVMLPGGLLKLCQALENNRHQGIRIVGCNTRYYSEPEKNDSGTSYFDLIRGRSRHEYPEHDVVCDGIQGCVMLLDPELIDRFGPEVFDPWLFIMTDETEVSLRAAEQGWKTYYVCAAVALHKRGRSTRKTTHINTYYSVRNGSYLALRYGATHRAIDGFLIYSRLIMTAMYIAIKFKRDAYRYDKIKAIFAGIQHARASMQSKLR